MVINQERILEELDKKGYNEKNLVPELEHVCHYIREKYNGKIENRKDNLVKLVYYDA